MRDRMATQRTLTLGEVTRQVAAEWMADGKLTVPPDADDTDEDAFWDAVRRRYDGQADP
jgi:hypothetical protein